MKCNKRLNVELESFLGRPTTKKVLDGVGKCPAMHELEDLTPGGSEFWEDPKRCSDCVRSTRESQHKMIMSKVTECKSLSLQESILREALADVLGGLSFIKDALQQRNYGTAQEYCDKVIWLGVSNAGASISRSSM